MGSKGVVLVATIRVLALAGRGELVGSRNASYSPGEVRSQV